eukprot:908667-Rhodomonas_salina.2
MHSSYTHNEQGAGAVLTHSYAPQQWMYAPAHPAYQMDAQNMYQQQPQSFNTVTTMRAPPRSTTLMHPRKKAETPAEGPESRTLTIDITTVTGLFHLPLQKAAESIGICVTSMKRVCRRLGISQWPYVKPTKASRKSMSPNPCSPATTASPGGLSCEDSKTPTSQKSFFTFAPTIEASARRPSTEVKTDIMRNDDVTCSAFEYSSFAKARDEARAATEMPLETGTKADAGAKADGFFLEGGVESVPLDSEFINTFIASDDDDENEL